MGLRTSIGKGTRVRHSTGLEWDTLEKAKKKHVRIIHSTGEGSKIRHSTGMEMDFRALYGGPEDDDVETSQETRLHSIPTKAGEDTEYLDHHIRSRRKGTAAQSKVADDERQAGGEDTKKANRDDGRERFSTVSTEY